MGYRPVESEISPSCIEAALYSQCPRHRLRELTESRAFELAIIAAAAARCVSRRSHVFFSTAIILALADMMPSECWIILDFSMMLAKRLIILRESDFHRMPRDFEMLATSRTP